jgi:myxalamid-type polyketide synthase MxaB
MEPILDEFERIAAEVQWHNPRLRLISNVSGREAGEEITTAAYWRSHLAQPVRFAESMAALAALGYRHFLEIGPQPMLLGIGRRCVSGEGFVWLPSLRSGHGDWEVLLESLGALYTQGAAIDWPGYERDFGPRRKLALPTYPFQRQRYWLEAARPQRAATVRPLIDKLIELPLHGETVYEAAFSVQTLPALADHRVYGAVVSPGAYQLAMALNAAELSFGRQNGLGLEDVVLPQALVLADGEERTVQAVFSSSADAQGGKNNGATVRKGFKIVSFTKAQAGEAYATLGEAESAIVTHAAGYALGAADAAPQAVDITAIQQRCTQLVDINRFYADSAAAQIELGPAFRWVAAAWRSADGEVLARLTRPAAASLPGYVLHPGLLDACFQTSAFTEEGGEVLLPFAVAALRLHRPAGGENWWCHAVQTGRHKCDIRLLDEGGSVVAELTGFELRAAPAEAIRRRPIWQQWLYSPQWRPQAQPQTAAAAFVGQTWLIFADGGGTGAALARGLRASGARVVTVAAGAGWRQQDADTLTIAAGSAGESAEDYRRLLASVRSLDGVVSLWSLDGAAAGAADPQGAALADCTQALLLVQALAAVGSAPAGGLWLVTRGAQAVTAGEVVPGAAGASLWGLGKVAALEHPELNAVCVDLAAEDATGQTSTAEDAVMQAAQLQAEITAAVAVAGAERERQVALRAAGRYVARLVRQAGDEQEGGWLALPEGPYRLEVSKRGSPDNLVLRAVERRAPGAGEVEIEVQAGGLNFRDVLNVLGAYPGEAGPVGGECAGVVVAVGEGVRGYAVGDSVLAMAAGSFSRYVTVRTEFVAHKPHALSMAEAAGLPVAYLTAYYGLHHLARMKAGDKVLVHAAAGGVGMAAVQLAQAAGAEVYATASAGKWELLRGMRVEHIYNSRDVGFAERILADTGGAGVDIILNSLTGPGFMEANLAVLAQGGYLAEMSKRNIWSAEQVAAARPDVRYTVFDLGEECVAHPPLWGELMDAVLRLLATGEVKPPMCTVYPVQEAVSAFRLMQGARHVGKVVLALGDGAGAVHADATYLVTGGLGGLGLAVARWLAERGTRHLLLVGRRGPGAEAQAQLAALAESGVVVTVAQADVSDRAAVASLLDGIDAAHPLRGVIHAAGVLDDGALMQQSSERFARVFAPKVAGAWHLHELTQVLAQRTGQELDFFVLFSSGSSVVGNQGQAIYAAANAFLDALAHRRRALGLPGLSINWGAWAEVGMAAGLVKRQAAQLAAQGTGVIAPEQGLAVLGHLIRRHSPQVAVLPVNWSLWQAANPAAARLSLLSDLIAQVAQPEKTAAAVTRATLAAAPESERSELLRGYLAEQVAQILHTPVAELNLAEPLTYLGMDSLMALELRNRIDAGLQLSVPVPTLLEGSSVDDLHTLLLGKLREEQPAAPSAALPPQAEQAASAVLAQLGEMSEENIDQLLERLLAEERLT